MRALLSRQPDSQTEAGSPRRAVVVLAQWNSDADGHIGLCKLLSKLGIASLRISLPYHDVRMPPELTRADYIVSSNIVRTLQVCRQAVRDVRLALWWLRDQGYERLGLLGTSLGSCLSFLTDLPRAAGEGAGAQSRVAVFRRRRVARTLDRARAPGTRGARRRSIRLRDLWRPISPWSFIDRLQRPQTLMVYAKYDLTFPVDLSLKLIDECGGAAFRSKSRCCRAATTRPAPRRSSISTGGISGNFWRRVCEPRVRGYRRSEPFAAYRYSADEAARARRRSNRRATGRAARLAGVHRLGHRDRIGQQQPHRGARNHGGKQPDDADEAEEPARNAEDFR